MTGRADKVQASMNAHVDLPCTSRLLFLDHVTLVLIIQEFDDWNPAVSVVHIVSKTGSVDDSQLDLKVLLFEFCMSQP